MLGGDWASDMAANGARNDAIRASRNAESWKKRAEEMIEYAAENAGIRGALAEALAHLDPKHALVSDPNLLERIKSAAVAAFNINSNDFGAAREAGRTFKIPGRENGPPPPVATLAPPKPGNDVAKLKSDYAGLVALRDALVRQLRINDPTNPLLGDPMLQMKVRAAGQTAFIMNGEDFESARNAGKTFAIPGRD